MADHGAGSAPLNQRTLTDADFRLMVDSVTDYAIIVLDPGGIVISGTAYDQAHNKLGLTFKSLGEQRLKNIPERVRAYRVLLEQTAGANKSRSRRWPRTRAGHRPAPG